MPKEKVIHVGFVGRELRRLEELQTYLGYVRELEGPETVSETVRFAVRHAWKMFDRAAHKDREEQESK